MDWCVFTKELVLSLFCGEWDAHTLSAEPGEPGGGGLYTVTPPAQHTEKLLQVFIATCKFACEKQAKTKEKPYTTRLAVSLISEQKGYRSHSKLLAIFMQMESRLRGRARAGPPVRPNETVAMGKRLGNRSLG